ncbi:hypothetical protein V9T40_008533 [Parthenolecanium corni]|uniref:Uncharacterized protein n=1 Tax=Parthenolecanium corni TaxID=536013 RepID=A0AAN9TNQ7_9HEMI
MRQCSARRQVANQLHRPHQNPHVAIFFCNTDFFWEPVRSSSACSAIRRTNLPRLEDQYTVLQYTPAQRPRLALPHALPRILVWT